MKFKYFLRGLGVGVLFCTFIVFAAYQTSPNKLLTDEEVKARAKELGMVEPETELDKVLQKDTNKKDDGTTEDGQSTEEGSVTEDNQSTENPNSEDDAASAAGNTTEPTKSTEEGNVTKQPKTTEVNNTTEQPKKTEEGNTTTEQPTEETGDEVTTATITVKRGMQSSTVARELEEKGIIKSASDFDNYLNKKGYSTKICVGTYSVKSSDSYETLAKILMKKK